MALFEERFPINDLHCEECASPLICAVTNMEGVQNAEIDMSVKPPELVIESLGTVTVAQVSGALETAVARLQQYKVGEPING